MGALTRDGLRIYHKDDLPLGGFAGIVETRMVMNPRLWPDADGNASIFHGLGDFIYMALGHFKPNDGAPMHPHRDVDIVTLVVDGEVGHRGTVGDGTIVYGPGVQVQRAGKGMLHSEFSNSSDRAGFVQLWFLPPERGLTPDYRNFAIDKQAGLRTVLGGDNGESFHSRARCEIGFLAQSDSLRVDSESVAIVFSGSGECEGQALDTGTLLAGAQFEVTANAELGLILIT